MRNLIELLKFNAQRYLSRFLLLMVVALGCFAVTATIRGLKLETRVAATEGDLKVAKNELETVKRANESLDSALTTMGQLRNADGTVLTALSNEIAGITARDRHVNERIAQLEKNNAAVREYLNTRGPVGMLCLLDNTCSSGGGSQNGGADPKQGNPPKVRAPSGPSKR